jgi:hypothetical protein
MIETFRTIAEIVSKQQPEVYRALKMFSGLDDDYRMIRHMDNIVALPPITDRDQAEPVEGELRAAL